MKFREHRGALDDAMATLVELPDRAALIAHVTKLYSCYVHGYDFTKIEVKPYFMERDTRIGWAKTYIVSMPGFGPIGFTDAPVSERQCAICGRPMSPLAMNRHCSLWCDVRAWLRRVL